MFLCDDEEDANKIRKWSTQSREDAPWYQHAFGRGGGKKKADDGKVKTKAKKKGYITGAHGSGSARQKAKYREQRANRHKK